VAQRVREPQSQIPPVFRIIAPGQRLEQVIQLRFEPYKPFRMLATRELGLRLLGERHIKTEMARARHAALPDWFNRS